MKPSTLSSHKDTSTKKTLLTDTNEDLFSTSINLSQKEMPPSVNHHHKRYHSKTSDQKSSSRKFRKKIQRNQKSRAHKDMLENSDDLAEAAFSDETDSFGENICAIHNKELDMICREPGCETPICSSCILFGEHKGHAYIEKDKFFKNIEMVRRGLLRVEKEIGKSEQAVKEANQIGGLMDRLEERRRKIEKEIEFNCSKRIRHIEARKLELQKETKFYFEKLGRSLTTFVKDNLEEIDKSKGWKRQVQDQLRRLPKDELDIDAGFAFLKQNNK